MKKILLSGLGIILLFFFSCKSTPKTITYTLKAKVPNIENQKAYLSTFDKKMTQKVIDTVEIKDSLLTFNVPQQNPRIAIISFDKSKLKIPVIIGDGNIDMTLKGDNPIDADLAKTTSQLTQKFYLHQKNIQKDKERGRRLIMAYRRTPNQEKKDSIRHAFENWQQMAQIKEYDYIRKNKDVTGLISMQTLLNAPDADFQKIKKAFEAYPINVKRSALGKYINTIILTKGATEIGGKAPNFTGTTPDGKKISLSQAMGKVTIIDFWASWCRPCRMENPYLVELYQKYHSQGLNIISISLDKNRDSWLYAIKNDRLSWPQVSELKFWQDPIAKMYGVVAIPQTFILDAQGVIRAKNLRREALEKKIKELLNE